MGKPTFIYTMLYPSRLSSDSTLGEVYDILYIVLDKQGYRPDPERIDIDYELAKAVVFAGFGSYAVRRGYEGGQIEIFEVFEEGVLREINEVRDKVEEMVGKDPLEGWELTMGTILDGVPKKYIDYIGIFSFGYENWATFSPQNPMVDKHLTQLLVELSFGVNYFHLKEGSDLDKLVEDLKKLIEQFRIEYDEKLEELLRVDGLAGVVRKFVHSYLLRTLYSYFGGTFDTYIHEATDEDKTEGIKDFEMEYNAIIKRIAEYRATAGALFDPLYVAMHKIKKADRNNSYKNVVNYFREIMIGEGFYAMKAELGELELVKKMEEERKKKNLNTI